MSHFRVHLSAEDQGAVHGESVWFEKQERLRADSRALWEFLRDDNRVERHVRCAATAEEVENTDDENVDREVSLEALSLAQRLEVPLLADDRCLQAAALNARPASASSSFSTTQLLESMAVDGHITRERYADSIRALMALRYRFIAPDPELLVFWARRAMTAMPGPDLLAMAVYLRACLRDPGLFGGLEPTDPPSTIAVKFHQAVETAVGEFIGALWSDEAITEERARLFTQWSLSYLLPSPPAVMEPRIRILGALGLPLFWFSLLMRLVRSSRAGTLDRTRRGLMIVGEAIGVPPHDVIRAATEIIDGISNRSG